MVDVSLEKVMDNIPKDIQQDILADLEKKMAEIRKEDNSKNLTFIMRSSKDFFVIVLDKEKKPQCQTIEFSHEKENIFFKLSEESDGTIRILDLLEILLAGSGKTYVIDELDRCLHPSLTFKFVEHF